MRILQSPRSEIDWPRLQALATHARFSAPLADTLEYLRAEFDAPVPRSALATLRATRLSVVERRAHGMVSRPLPNRGPVGVLSFFWVRYRALARLRSQRPGALGFLSYIQGYWGLRSPRRVLWRVPSWLARRVLAR